MNSASLPWDRYAKDDAEKGTAEIIDLAKSNRVRTWFRHSDCVRHTPQEQVADPAVIKGNTRSPCGDDHYAAIRAKLELGANLSTSENYRRSLA